MSITVEQFAAKLEALGQGKALAGLLRKEMIATGLQAQGGVQLAIRDRLARRSGGLMRSPAFRVDTLGALPQLTVSSGGGKGARGELRYAALQEYGGTVRPTKGQWLAIPVGPALTPSGVARYATARDVPGLTFIHREGAGAILAKVKPGRKGAEPSLEVWFDLRRQVTIRGKYFTRDGVQPAFAGFNARVADAIAKITAPASPSLGAP